MVHPAVYPWVREAWPYIHPWVREAWPYIHPWVGGMVHPAVYPWVGGMVHPAVYPWVMRSLILYTPVGHERVNPIYTRG